MADSDFPGWHGTTIIGVKKDGEVVIAHLVLPMEWRARRDRGRGIFQDAIVEYLQPVPLVAGDRARARLIAAPRHAKDERQVEHR